MGSDRPYGAHPAPNRLIGGPSGCCTDDGGIASTGRVEAKSGHDHPDFAPAPALRRRHTFKGFTGLSSAICSRLTL